MIRDQYVNELNTLRPTLEYIAAFSVDEAMEKWTDADLDHYAATNARYGEVLEILEDIDAAVTMMQTAQARHDFPGLSDIDLQAMNAQKSDTLALMNDVARHLCGRSDVVVTIEQPRNNYGGLCIWQPYDPKHAIKLQISPRVIVDVNEGLHVFLHEVAHAKLHPGPARDAQHAEKMEGEAMQQARYWQHYAKTHSAPIQYMPDVGGDSMASNYFRLQLLTLLKSDEAARRTIAQ